MLFVRSNGAGDSMYREPAGLRALPRNHACGSGLGEPVCGQSEGFHQCPQVGAKETRIWQARQAQFGQVP